MMKQYIILPAFALGLLVCNQATAQITSAEVVKTLPKTLDKKMASTKNVINSRADDVTFNGIPWKGSMMFTRKQLDKIYRILNNAELLDDSQLSNNSIATINGSTDTIRPQPITIFAPAYNVQSILYYKQDNWTVWIDGKRNRSGRSRNDKLTIDHVYQNTMQMTYVEPNLNDMLPGWQNYFEDYSTYNGDIYVSQENEKGYHWDYVSENGEITIDSDKGAVRFIIKPSQSFVSYKLAILEGKQEGKPITFTPGRSEEGYAADGTILQLDDAEREALQGDNVQPESNELMNRVFNNINR